MNKMKNFINKNYNYKNKLRKVKKILLLMQLKMLSCKRITSS